MWENGDQPIPQTVLAAVMQLQSRGRSIVVVRHQDRFLGTLGIADRLRDNANNTLRRLRDLGISSIIMLTGDNRGVGDAIGREAGVDEVKAELLPEDKVIAIRELQGRFDRVAMVGDGVNDAPALANATVGIAMGGAGTAVALETADVALMGDDLGKLPFVIRLSRQARSIIRQNLVLSLSVIALLLVATTTGLFNIATAVVFHEGSTLLVVANALRLLGVKDRVDSPYKQS
jgi:Cd2+/Zn2+-exporting ATPase